MKTLLGERISRNIKENMGIYFLVILFFSIGLAIGGFAIKSLDEGSKKEILNYMNNFFKVLSGEDVSGMSIFLQSAKNNLISILIIWIASLTVIGVPVALMVIGFRGIVLGFSMGFFIESMGMKGIVFSLVSIIPQNMVYIPSILFISALSLVFSISLIKMKKGYKGHGGSNMLSYSMMVGMVFLITLIGSITEGFVVPAIVKALSNYFIVA